MKVVDRFAPNESVIIHVEWRFNLCVETFLSLVCNLGHLAKDSYTITDQCPVVQSIVSLTSSLRGQLVLRLYNQRH